MSELHSDYNVKWYTKKVSEKKNSDDDANVYHV